MIKNLIINLPIVFILSISGTQAQTNSNKTQSSKQVIPQATLLLKTNTKSKVKINGVEVGIVDASTLKSFKVNPGKSFLTLLPFDLENFITEDTIINIKANEQDALIINLKEVVLTKEGIMNKVYQATGLSEIGKTIQSLFLEFDSEKIIDTLLFSNPNNIYYSKNNKTKKSASYLELFKGNNSFTRNHFNPIACFKDDNYYTQSQLIHRHADDNKLYDYYDEWSQNQNDCTSADLIFGSIFFGTIEKSSYYVDMNKGEPAISTETINDRKAIKIIWKMPNATNDFEVQDILYIDKETYLPLKRIFYYKSLWNWRTEFPRLELQVETSFSKYQNFGVLTLPSIKNIEIVKNKIKEHDEHSILDNFGTSVGVCGITKISNFKINPKFNNPEEIFFTPHIYDHPKRN